jgi:hypothetical protein
VCLLRWRLHSKFIVARTAIGAGALPRNTAIEIKAA